MPRPLSQEARQKAIDATLALVAERGIDGFTVDAVSRRSGVAKTTLYRHWGSGGELLVQALDCRIERLPTPDTGSLRGDLEAIFSMLATMSEDPSHRRLMLDLLSAAARDPELAAVQQAMARERTRPVRQLVSRAIERGEIPDTDVELAALFIEGPVVARMMLSPAPLDRAEIPVVVELLARGLGAS